MTDDTMLDEQAYMGLTTRATCGCRWLADFPPPANFWP